MVFLKNHSYFKTFVINLFNKFFNVCHLFLQAIDEINFDEIFNKYITMIMKSTNIYFKFSLSLNKK